MTLEITAYSSKSTALRGAKRAGIENPEAFQMKDGKWGARGNAKKIEQINVMLNDALPFNYDAMVEIANGLNVLTDETLAEIEAAPVARELTEGELAIQEVIGKQDFAGVGDSFKGLKLPSYKVLARESDRKSLVDGPCAFVHQFFSDNPGLTRKEAVAAVMKYGVNYSTARTQYQKWFTARKG